MNFDKIHSFVNNPIISITKNSSGTRLAALTVVWSIDNIISFFSLNEFKKYEFKDPSSQLIISHKGSQIKFAPSVVPYSPFLISMKESIFMRKQRCKKEELVSSENFIFPEEKILDFKFSPIFLGFQFAVALSFGILRV